MDVTAFIGWDDVPEPMRALTTLARVDHADSYTAPAPAARSRSAEEWARAILERTPLGARARRLWRVIGLELGRSGSPDHVQGWRIAGRGGDWVRIETRSWYATAQAVCRVGADDVTMAVFLRFDRAAARLVWALIGPVHTRAVPALLRQALRADAYPDAATADSG